MPLDAQTTALLSMFKEMGLEDAYKNLPLPAFRECLKPPDLDLALERQGLAAVEDRWIPGPGGTIPVRIYRAQETVDKISPLLIYYHGGGFVLGDLDGYDGLCSQLTRAAGCVTLSVDYRLAPEHPYPAAMDDAEAALRWAAGHAGELGIDPSRIALGGDSAGATLSISTAMRAKTEGGPTIASLLLAYPPTDFSGRIARRDKNADGYFLTADVMEWFSQQFFSRSEHRALPDASPLLAEDLAGLPPALVLTAEYDPLLEEGELFAGRLRDAGVPVRLHRYAGTIHGFLGFYPMIDQGREAIAEFAAALRALT